MSQRRDPSLTHAQCLGHPAIPSPLSLVIAGCDEVGRGALAGPIVGAAVVFISLIPQGIRDSKLLTPNRRQVLSAKLKSSCDYAISFVDHGEADCINVRQASIKAMTSAASALATTPELVLVDGIDPLNGPWACRSIIAGDRLIPQIAAASIIAKVARDDFMKQAALLYPGYGFERNSGYGTLEHLAALRTLGPSPLHRQSCRVVRQWAPDDARLSHPRNDGDHQVEPEKQHGQEDKVQKA